MILSGLYVDKPDCIELDCIDACLITEERPVVARLPSLMSVARNVAHLYMEF